MKKKTKLIQIGNSKGFRIPKEFLEYLNITNEITMEAIDNELIIKPTNTTRQDWEESFSSSQKDKQDLLIPDNLQNSFDGEWEWK